MLATHERLAMMRVVLGGPKETTVALRIARGRQRQLTSPEAFQPPRCSSFYVFACIPTVTNLTLQLSKFLGCCAASILHWPFSAHAISHYIYGFYTTSMDKGLFSPALQRRGLRTCLMMPGIQNRQVCMALTSSVTCMRSFQDVCEGRS